MMNFTVVSHQNLNNKSYNKFVLTDKSPWINYSVTIICILQFLLCLIGNVLDLYILPRIKQPYDYITYALCTLACYDLLQGLITIPETFLIATFDDWLLGNFLCKFTKYFTFVNRINGVWTTVYITFDRYINICYPFHFLSLKSKGFCLIVLSCIFVGNSILGFYVFVYTKTVYEKTLNIEQCSFQLPSEALHICHRLIINVTYIFGLPVTLIILFYTAILRTLLKVMSMKSLLQSKSNNDDEIEEAPELMKRESSNYIIVKVLFFLIIFFIFINFPYILSRMSTIISVELTRNGKYKIVRKIVLVFQTINSSLNPWIYFIYSQKFREEAREIVLRCFCGERKGFTLQTIFNSNLLKKSSIFSSLEMQYD